MILNFFLYCAWSEVVYVLEFRHAFSTRIVQAESLALGLYL